MPSLYGWPPVKQPHVSLLSHVIPICHTPIAIIISHACVFHAIACWQGNPMLTARWAEGFYHIVLSFACAAVFQPDNSLLHVSLLTATGVPDFLKPCYESLLPFGGIPNDLVGADSLLDTQQSFTTMLGVVD